jgi:hypothetical protein
LQRQLAVAEEGRHTLPQRDRFGFSAAAAAAAPADPEFLRLVDHRLDPEDRTGFVVHLDPVLFHPMLHPPARHAAPELVLDSVGDQLALELAVELPAQEGQHVRGREAEGAGLEQPGEEVLERLSAHVCARAKSSSHRKTVSGFVDPMPCRVSLRASHSWPLT